MILKKDMPKDRRSLNWLEQAKNDFLFAKTARAEKFFAQTCFICQQVAGKALKSVLYARGAKAVITHSLMDLCEELKINSKLRKAAGVLDQYYLSARYPDALPGGAPYQVFTEEQAKEAIQFADLFLEVADREG